MIVDLIMGGFGAAFTVAAAVMVHLQPGRERASWLATAWLSLGATGVFLLHAIFEAGR